MAELKIGYVKISVSVRKTVQEVQYEPLSIELSAEEIVKKSRRDSRYKELHAELREMLGDFINA